MLEIIQFLFSNFWRWLGAFLMLWVIAESFGGVFSRLLNTIARRRS